MGWKFRYLDFLVNIPISTGKITYRKKGDTDYVDYEYKRIYTKGSNMLIQQLLQRIYSIVICLLCFYHFLLCLFDLLFQSSDYDAKRKEDLWNAIIKSKKSYDEILKFINADQKSEND